MKYITSFFIFFFFSGGAFSSAYIPPKGHGIFILGVRSYKASSFFDRDRKKQKTVNNGSFERLQLDYFWEHGFRKKWSVFAFGTIFGEVKFKDSSGGSNNTSLGHQEIGVKYNYSTSKYWRRSWKLSTAFPLYSRSGNPLIGNHQHDVEIRHSWDDLDLSYFSYQIFELAMRLRFDQPADEIRASYTLGKNWERNGLFFQSYLAYGLRNQDGAGVEANTNLSSDFDQLVAGINYTRKIKKTWTAQIGYFRDIWGRTVSAGNTFVFNIWKNY